MVPLNLTDKLINIALILNFVFIFSTKFFRSLILKKEEDKITTINSNIDGDKRK